jgi:hypothetical protein
LNFIQRSELCIESLNSNKAKSFCEKNIKYVVEVIGTPSSDINQFLTGILIFFSIFLIGIIIFIIVKTEGCKNIRYFKLIKKAEIRERLYYDAGEDINLEAIKQRDILSERVLLENQKQEKNLIEMEKKEPNSINNILKGKKSFRFVFNSEMKKFETDDPNYNSNVKMLSGQENVNEDKNDFNFDKPIKQLILNNEDNDNINGEKNKYIINDVKMDVKVIQLSNQNSDRDIIKKLDENDYEKNKHSINNEFVVKDENKKMENIINGENNNQIENKDDSDNEEKMKNDNFNDFDIESHKQNEENLSKFDKDQINS